MREYRFVTDSSINRWRVPPNYGIEASDIRPLGSGLINHTWIVEDVAGRRFVLQRMHEMFPGEINRDIELVTAHLESSGFPTPRLLRTGSGGLWVEADDGIWRMMTYVQGVSLNALETEQQAREAGALLGRFHLALAGIDHEFVNERPGVHDTPRHLANLEKAIADHGDHPRYGEIRPLAERILDTARSLPELEPMDDRVVHGDPKINNILFDRDTRHAVCLVDLDTLSHMPLPLELGDAFRSWCNPAGEDSTKTGFSLDFFEGAVNGYASATRDWISNAEVDAIVPATYTILVELSARFCADALTETYFGWDPSRFPSRSVHNQVRAEGQLTTASMLADIADQARMLVDRPFGNSGQ